MGEYADMDLYNAELYDMYEHEENRIVRTMWKLLWEGKCPACTDKTLPASAHHKPYCKIHSKTETEL